MTFFTNVSSYYSTKQKVIKAFKRLRKEHNFQCVMNISSWERSRFGYGDFIYFIRPKVPRYRWMSKPLEFVYKGDPLVIYHVFESEGLDIGLFSINSDHKYFYLRCPW